MAGKVLGRAGQSAVLGQGRSRRAAFVSNATGKYEVSCWDVTGDRHGPATDRPDGTVHAALSADGTQLWWFDDDAGDEFGSWQVQPFGAGPGESTTAALPTVSPGYSAGLEVGRTRGAGRFLRRRRHPDPPVTWPVASRRSSITTSRTPASAPSSTDETMWVLSHSEHGDSRYPALRALSVPSGEVIAELSDAPGKGLAVITFSPIPGDQRVLVGHERRGRDELLIWDLSTGSVTELPIDLPGDLDADFYPDGQALLVVHTHAGRTTVHRYDLASGELTALPVPRRGGVGCLRQTGRIDLVPLVERSSTRAAAGPGTDGHRPTC